MMNSLWYDDVQLPEFPRMEGIFKTDVLIIGGGMAGLLCALKLREAGVDYLLVEADRICSGTTGRTTAKLTSQHGLIYQDLLRRFGTEKARLYYQANENALDAWRRLCAGIDCDFREEDSFVYSRAGTECLERELEALAMIGAEADLTRTDALPFPTDGAVRFPHQARFHPLKFAAAIAKDLNIFEHTPVRSYNGFMYRTDNAIIRANRCIAATHFPLWNKHGAYFLKQYQHRSYVLALEHAAPIEGMYLDASGKGLSLRQQGKLLLLGGGSHRTGHAGGGWEALERAATVYFPGASIRHRWAAQDCMTLDDMPYIGRYSPRTPDLYAATGFGKWGMTSSMIAAQLLCDQITGKENPFTDLFSPARSMLHPRLFANGANALWNLLTPTVPRCPHMGCALKWNRQEHSWDCPCHGSRFEKDGHLLEGPAMGDLRKVQKPGGDA